MATYTELSATVLPGKPHNFSAKSFGTHTGDFTRLSVVALPGGIRTFAPKSKTIVVGPADVGGGGFTGGGFTGSSRYVEPFLLQRALRDDEDFLQLLAAAMPIIMRG